MVLYGNSRANQISSKFVNSFHTQDLIHVFSKLVVKQGPEASLKLVERMSKLNRVGSEETASLRKICKWSPPAFNSLVNVLNAYERYETLDVKKLKNTKKVSRCEKMSLSNKLFNMLSKIQESQLISSEVKVIRKEISLKTVI